MLATLNSDRFADKAPRQVVATLLDEDRYLCSVRTMYRVLADAGGPNSAGRPGVPSAMRRAIWIAAWLGAAACTRGSPRHEPPQARAADDVEVTVMAERYVDAVRAWTLPPGPDDHDAEELGSDPMEHATYRAHALDVVTLAREVAAATNDRAIAAAHAKLAVAIDAAPDDSLADVEREVQRTLRVVRARLDEIAAQEGGAAACVMARVGVGDASRELGAAIDEAAFRGERDLHETGLPPGDPELEDLARDQRALADALVAWTAWLGEDSIEDAAAPDGGALGFIARAPAIAPDQLERELRTLLAALDRARAACTR